MSSIDAVVGLQRGDEGKGRYVDMLADEYNIVARFNGGANAGHTVVLPDGTEFALHQVPSGITHKDTVNIIGNGTLLHPEKLLHEIEIVQSKDVAVSPDNLKVSSAAHLTLPHHIFEDELREIGNGQQGSTKSGIAYTSAAKALREGVRAEIINNRPETLEEIVLAGLKQVRQAREEAGFDEIDEQEIAKNYLEKALKIGAYVTDTVFYLNDRMRAKHPINVLAEGAQGFLLDVDQGMYPFTTSTGTTIAEIPSGLGVGPSFMRHTYGVVKMIQSHVGGGPFVTEINDAEFLDRLHGDRNSIDAEKGTTTQRERRLGYVDLPQIRRALMLNGRPKDQSLALTKLDWIPRFGDELKICVAYERKGKTIEIAPDAAYKLEQSAPIYERLPNWQEDISEVKRFADLPPNAQNLISFIMEQTGVMVEFVGVGPRRDQVINMHNA